MWIVISTVLAGALIGFVTGGARVSSAGHITSGVTGFLVGVAVANPENQNTEYYAQVFSLYLVTLFIVYVAANILRHKGKLMWLYGKRNGK